MGRNARIRKLIKQLSKEEKKSNLRKLSQQGSEKKSSPSVKTRKNKMSKAGRAMVPMGEIAAHLYKTLGRGAVVNEQGCPAWYCLAPSDGNECYIPGIASLIASYAPEKEYVLIDVMGPSSMSMIFKLDDKKQLRLALPAGRTVQESVEHMAKHNKEIAAAAVRRWNLEAA